MRLLHFDHSGRLISTNFGEKSVPSYAILSHRWGESEVLLEDLRSDTYTKKDGYRKIEFCAEQAAHDQLQYFWIDTCCIDKWDLRERSKAINSMFRWYKNATKCYVFLSDVSNSPERLQPSSWEASFRASEWFTRGWTLQELIAPRSVEFFSREGQRIGDKASLERLVHEVTDVPLKALQNCPLTEFTISERMEWARNRETTEEEDAVYCLLGILDVFMPSSYGEGKEKASRRLQIELATASSAPSFIPFSRNEYFVGRESQLAELEAKLFGDIHTTSAVIVRPAETGKSLAIVGPAGTGKSHLALEFAYRMKQKNKSRSVCWVDASDINSIDRSYASIAQKLDVPGWDDEKADIKQLVKLHLSRKNTSQCLLIFANTEDVTLGSSGLSTARAANVSDYLPQSELCSIVFTTTNSDTAKRLASLGIVELADMTPDMAQRLLHNCLNTPVSENEQQEAKLLLQELLFLPLAIIQAAAYINTSSITLQEYRSLVKQKQEAPERASEVSEDKLQEYDINGPITTTLLISIDRIRHEDALAADYLLLAACVDRKDIPLDLLEASTSRERENAMKTLSRYRLITRRPAESSFDLHQLVHQALRELLRKQGRLVEWTQNAITHLLREFPDDHPQNRSKWRRLLPHAQYALSHDLVDREDANRLDLAWQCATALCIDGRYNESEKLDIQVLETRKRVLGDEHPDTLMSMNHIALTVWSQGRWKEAEELEVKVLEIRKRVLGDEHPDTLISMGNLATTYMNQGRLKEAEELEVQVLETRTRVLGNEHPETLNSMNSLALLLSEQGRWREAEELKARVVEMRRRVLGDEHPHTLNSMNNLAIAFSDQEQWKEAEELGVHVLEVRKRVLGDEHPDTLISIANLALTYSDQKRWKEAEELEVQVLEMRKRVLGNEHPETLTSMANLALTYSNQGHWKGAEELGMEVLDIKKRVLGDEHPNTLNSVNILASTYHNQGRLKEAEDLKMHVLEMRKKVLGSEHPDTLACMHSTAYMLEAQGSLRRAISLMEQCCELRTKVLGPQHSKTVASYEALAAWRLKALELGEQNET